MATKTKEPLKQTPNHEQSNGDKSTENKVAGIPIKVEKKALDLSDVPDFAATKEDEEKIRMKCQNFNNWCKEQGISFPKLEYPAFFDGGLVGAKVT